MRMLPSADTLCGLVQRSNVRCVIRLEVGEGAYDVAINHCHSPFVFILRSGSHLFTRKSTILLCNTGGEFFDDDESA